MTWKSRTLLVTALGIICLSTGAVAGDIYIQGRMGASQFDVEFEGNANAAFVETSTSVALEAGYRFLPFFALQGGYHNFGEVSDSDLAIVSPTGWSLTVMAQTPKLLLVRFYGKLGLMYWQAPVEYGGALGREDFSGTDPVIGGGVRLTFLPKLEAILEYETFEMGAAGESSVGLAQRVQTVSVGLGVKF